MSPFNLAEYEPVEDRLRAFWSDHPEGRVNTELVHVGADGYIVKASVWRSPVLDSADLPDGTGFAQEQVTERGVNSTSALENCETSAIGRALANLGYAAKGKRPSREEMAKSLSRETPAGPLGFPPGTAGDTSAHRAVAAGADGGGGVDTTSSVPPEQSPSVKGKGAGDRGARGSQASGDEKTSEEHGPRASCKHLNGIDVDGRCTDCGEEMVIA